MSLESELRQIEGLVKVLVVLGEADDSVEPVALSALANAGRAAVETVWEQWRAGYEVLQRERNLG